MSLSGRFSWITPVCEEQGVCPKTEHEDDDQLLGGDRGWGTPPIPGGGNKETGVLEETVKVELNSSEVGKAIVTPREAIRGVGSASFPSHSTTVCK